MEKMFEYGAYVADPSGCMPRNGDADLDCGSGYNEKAATYFARDDWTYVHTNGASGTAPTGVGHATPSVMFPWAGQAVFRSGYDSNATWAWFDVGPFGSNPFHANMD